MKTDDNWRQVQDAFFTTKKVFKVRSRGKVYLYEVQSDTSRVLIGIVDDAEDEITLLHGEGVRHIEIEATKGAEAYLHDTVRTGAQRAVDDVFTSLDTPRPMSPEMQEITRMMRRNDLSRRHELNELRRTMQDVAAIQSKQHADQPAAKPSETPSAETQSEGPEGRPQADDSSGADDLDGAKDKRSSRNKVSKDAAKTVQE